MIKPSVLIVENSLFMYEKIKYVLSQSDCEVIGWAKNAFDSIALYQELKPDLVTMDVVMPMINDVDGIAALKEIRAIDADAKIIMITAIDQKGNIDECMEAGAIGYIVKPVDPGLLQETIRSTFGP